MNNEEARMVVLRVAINFLGGFYKWGGDDPSGFDCSGLAVECMKSIGLVGRKKDATAAGMYAHWQDGLYQKDYKKPRAGDLVFWQSAGGRIIHIEIVFNDALSIGASGGGSSTHTVEDAIAQNAFIKIRPFDSRAGLAGFIDPYGLTPL